MCIPLCTLFKSQVTINMKSAHDFWLPLFPLLSNTRCFHSSWTRIIIHFVIRWGALIMLWLREIVSLYVHHHLIALTGLHWELYFLPFSASSYRKEKSLHSLFTYLLWYTKSECRDIFKTDLCTICYWNETLNEIAFDARLWGNLRRQFCLKTVTLTHSVYLICYVVRFTHE